MIEQEGCDTYGLLVKMIRPEIHERYGGEP